MDTSNYTIGTYLAYLAISIAMCIWVARTLHKNGAIFLIEAFRGNKELAGSVNHLLVVGFYLINLGYITMMLQGTAPQNLVQAIEILSFRIGRVLLILGAMHFFNLFVFSRMRKRGIQGKTPPKKRLFNSPPPVPTEPAPAES